MNLAYVSSGAHPVPHDTAQALIYRSANGAPCSQCWFLEFAPAMAPRLQSLLRSVAPEQSIGTVTLKFPDFASALTFAKRQGWSYHIPPHQQNTDPRACAAKPVKPTHVTTS